MKNEKRVAAAAITAAAVGAAMVGASACLPTPRRNVTRSGLAVLCAAVPAIAITQRRHAAERAYRDGYRLGIQHAGPSLWTIS
ncbi:putative peptide ABC transporter permease protein [Streptomyces sp. NBRC 110611]|nr:putative peptide ABC transporter permease protein [Streptomyces sp. NBRC 110611]